MTWTVRIKRWDEVKRLLGQLRAGGWNLEQQSELSREAGATLWYRMRQADAGLTEEELGLITELLVVPGKLARETTNIDRWIAALASPTAGERRKAQLGLQAGGMVALQRLSERLLDGASDVEPAILASTIMSFGRDGREALRTAWLVVIDPVAASRALMAIAKLPGKQFATELVRP